MGRADSMRKGVLGLCRNYSVPVVHVRVRVRVRVRKEPWRRGRGDLDFGRASFSLS